MNLKVKKKPQETREKTKQQKKQEAAAKRAVLDAVKHEDADLYPARKGKLMKLLRIALWVMIGFVFLKGVAVSLRPDPTVQVNSIIDQFKAEYTGYQRQDSEVMAFAEGFATEYMTYSDQAGVDEYKARLQRYAADTVTAAMAHLPTGAAAQVVHALAYKKEDYSATQADVWVQLEVTYTQRSKSPDGIETTQSTTEKTILKVPVRIADERYIVEDFPAFVNDAMRLDDFKAAAYTGSEADSATNEGITEALTNFYRAYYENEQSVINYYLAPDADTTKFVGLGGRVAFKAIAAVRSFYTTEGDATHFRVIASVTVTDKNGVELPQNFNLTMVLRDKQYYVVTMDTRNRDIVS